MRKICGCAFLLAIAPALFSCLNEQNIELAKPATFVRYINGGKNEVAKALAKTPDGGYIILANREFGGLFRIKLIKTDPFGIVEWARFFPAFEDFKDTDSVKQSLRGNGISLLQDPAGGYIIAGEDIHNDTTKLAILVTNGEGLAPRKAILSPPSAGGYNLSGLAVTTNQSGNFIVLGNISGSPIDNMILAEVDKDNLNILWDKSYGSGPSTLVNKIFIDENQKAVWSGTVANGSNRTDIRFIKSPQNSEGTDFDNGFGEPNFDERASDLCRFGTSYALVGSTNQKASGTDRDIIFKRITTNGDLLTSITFPLTYSDGTDTQQDEEGNSVSHTTDSGFIILGTIVSTTSGEETIGRGEKDYYLIKVNGFGEVEWTRAFGSKRDDIGVSVLQADDGGYVVLGTTRLANVETIALIKTNKDGNVE